MATSIIIRMCGIVAYLGQKVAQPILIEGLKRLEYRGYDSAGICIQNDDKLCICKDTGRVMRMEQQAIGALRVCLQISDLQGIEPVVVAARQELKALGVMPPPLDHGAKNKLDVSASSTQMPPQPATGAPNGAQ